MLQYMRTWLRTNMLYRSIKCEEGQDLAEYALLIALVAIVVVVAITARGNTTGNTFNKVKDNIGL